MKLQPSTPTEFRAQCEFTMKDAVAVVYVAVADCTALFEQFMEVIVTL